MKKFFSVFMLAFLIPVASCSAQSDDSAANQFVEGRDYGLLARPVKTSDPEKIEVTEVFWYGCIHCFRLEPELQAWLPTVADDVEFFRIPAIWAEVMELHAAMYYANEVLGIEEELHQPIFNEMNVERNQLGSEEAILDFVSDHGVDPDQYRRALNSFGVSSQVQQARAKMGAYAIRGTPEMVVNGKYKLTSQMAGSFPRMLQIADALIEQERQAMAGSAQ